MKTRREFLVTGGAGLLTVSLACFAQQQGKVRRVGFLGPRPRPASPDADVFGGFPEGMRVLGYVEGKNLVIEWRSADGKYERFPLLAAELVSLKVDVIVTAGTPATRAAQKATATIPIVMGSTGDPVGDGFVKSLARPGGNITGLTNVNSDLGPKHLEFLLGTVSRLSRVAVLVNPDNSAFVAVLKNIQAAGQSAGVRILPVEARTVQEIETAFSLMTREHAGAVIVGSDGFLNQQLRQIAELAATNRLPSITGAQGYPEAGGLMRYGQDLAGQYRSAAGYVDKILKGAKPGDLPVEQPTRLELVINRKTAKTLGITIPQSILVRADRVIG